MPTEKNIINTVKSWAFTATMGFAGFMGYRMVDTLDRLRIEVAEIKVNINDNMREIDRLRDAAYKSNIPDTDQSFERLHMLATMPDKIYLKNQQPK